MRVILVTGKMRLQTGTVAMEMQMKMRIKVQDTMSRMVQMSGGMRIILLTGKMRLQTGTVTMQMKMRMMMRQPLEPGGKQDQVQINLK